MDVPIIGLVVGLTFILLLFSVLASHITEIVASSIGLRGYVLRDGVAKMFESTKFRDRIYKHPLFKSESVGRGRFGNGPSYVDPAIFALVIINLGVEFTEPTNGAPGKTTVRPNLSGKTTEVLSTLVGNTVGSATAAQAILEQWFLACTKRISGSYKRLTFPLLLAVSIVIVAAFNVDIIKISNRLYFDPSLRAVTAQQAQSSVTAAGRVDVGTALAHLQIPLGWGRGNRNAPDSTLGDGIHLDSSEDAITYFRAHNILACLGLLLAGALLSLGAPFWFDMANKVVNVRGSGPAASNAGIPIVPRTK